MVFLIVGIIVLDGIWKYLSRKIREFVDTDTIR